MKASETHNSPSKPRTTPASDMATVPSNAHSSSTTTSSRSTASRPLDPNSSRPVFVYKLRNGTHISTEAALCEKLRTDPSFARCRCSSVPIPRGASRVAVHTQDLWSDDQRAMYAHYPNSSSSIASVGLPRSVYWRRMLMGQYQDMYIVSPDNSPASSADASPDDSRHVSPSNTFYPVQEAS